MSRSRRLGEQMDTLWNTVMDSVSTVIGEFDRRLSAIEGLDIAARLRASEDRYGAHHVVVSEHDRRLKATVAQLAEQVEGLERRVQKHDERITVSDERITILSEALGEMVKFSERLDDLDARLKALSSRQLEQYCTLAERIDAHDEAIEENRAAYWELAKGYDEVVWGVKVDGAAVTKALKPDTADLLAVADEWRAKAGNLPDGWASTMRSCAEVLTLHAGDRPRLSEVLAAWAASSDPTVRRLATEVLAVLDEHESSGIDPYEVARERIAAWRERADSIEGSISDHARTVWSFVTTELRRCADQLEDALGLGDA